MSNRRRSRRRLICLPQGTTDSLTRPGPRLPVERAARRATPAVSPAADLPPSRHKEQPDTPGSASSRGARRQACNAGGLAGG